MRSLLLLIALTCLAHPIFSQYVYTIKADSVKITNCDSAELIIENHTQNIPGFLFNTGNGRTIFQRGAQSIGNGSYLVGADTIKTSNNAWLQGGNAFGATGVLGTLDNSHLDLYTNDTARARLTNTGNLLLGTTTDGGQLLQVNGSSYFNGGPVISMQNFTVDFITPSIVQTPILRFTNNFTSQQAMLGINGYNGALNISFSNSDPNVDPYITFGPTVTNFGIYRGGYTVFANGPAFNTFDGVNYGGVVVAGQGNTGGFGPKLDFAVGDQVTGNPVIGGGIFMSKLNLGSSNVANVSTQMSFHLRQDSSTIVEIMRLRNDGNVLIGTTTDNGYLLQVGGSISATGAVQLTGLTTDSTQTRVLVGDANGNLYYRSASSLAAADVIRSSLAVNGPISAQRLTLSKLDWPDYVFDSTYNLPSLAETEDYIHRQHHLPGIPSAAEVETKGVEIGDTQAALLKKIEELTLYAIRQDKNLDEQATEIQALKAEMEVLTKLIRNNPEK